MRWLGLFALLLATSASCQQLAGNLTISGSDTLAGAVARAAEAFQAMHPEVHVQLQTPGSASAVAALLDGAIDIGSMSRSLSNAERVRFQQRNGIAPMQVAIARDALVVIVHPDNPLRQISIKQIDAIFSSAPTCGHALLRRWSELGVTLNDATTNDGILVVGRNAASGTHAFFQSAAMCGDAYRDDIVEWPGNGAVVHAVAQNREAIGYAAAGSVGAQVRELAIVDDSGKLIGSDENARDVRRSPLARELFLVANPDARGQLRPLTLAFMAYMLSDDAQTGLHREGLQTLSQAERREAAATLK